MDSVYEGSVGSDGDESSHGPGAVDGRVAWLATTIQDHIPAATSSAGLEFLSSDEFVSTAQKFILSGRIGGTLYVSESGGRFGVALGRPVTVGAPPSRRLLCFTRALGGELHLDDQSRMGHCVLVHDVGDPLCQVEAFTRCVVLPVLGLSASSVGFLPSVISKEVTDGLRALLADTQVVLGQTEGDTRLPMPLLEPEVRRDEAPLSQRDAALAQDSIHAYESSVVTWVRHSAVCALFHREVAVLSCLRVCVWI